MSNEVYFNRDTDAERPWTYMNPVGLDTMSLLIRRAFKFFVGEDVAPGNAGASCETFGRGSSAGGISS